MSFFFEAMLGLAPILLAGTVMFGLEMGFPKREDRQDGYRWMLGVALTAFCWLAVTLVAPVTGYLAAVFANYTGLGILHALSLPFWVMVLAGFLLFDLQTYVTHRILHEVPGFWRLHRVHHSDTVLDASVALRFHPFEAVFNSAFAALVAVAFGVPPIAIVLHSIAQQCLTFWQHANVCPFPGQTKLGAVLNIPEFHEIHHSADARHYNANYGTVLSVWDRMFGSLIEPETLQAQLTFGIDAPPDRDAQTLIGLLTDPFHSTRNDPQQDFPTHERELR